MSKKSKAKAKQQELEESITYILTQQIDLTAGTFASFYKINDWQWPLDDVKVDKHIRALSKEYAKTILASIKLEKEWVS